MINRDPSSRRSSVLSRPIDRREVIIRGGRVLSGLTLSYLLSDCGSGSPIKGGGSTSQGPAGKTSEAGKKPEKYPTHAVMASIFWIGEGASSDNANISNVPTEWDPDAVKHFGGVDDPRARRRNGLPARFEPLQNPYYVALPASEFGDNGLIPGAREHAPWYHGETSERISVFKGHWLKIANAATSRTVYAQWLDTGPSDDPTAVYDYPYVFGPSSAKPKNKFGLGAGIDISPTAAYGLGVPGDLANGSAEVTWQFVDPSDVPPGPWRQFPPINDVVYW